MAERGAFDDMKVELVEGELQRMNPPLGGHATRQATVIGALWTVARRAGLVVTGETGIDLGGDTVVACDAALLRQPIGDRALASPGDMLLVVEVAETTLGRDLGFKLAAYAGAGIPTYWVVDSARAVIHVYSAPEDGDYHQQKSVRFGEPLSVPGTEQSIVVD